MNVTLKRGDREPEPEPESLLSAELLRLEDLIGVF